MKEKTSIENNPQAIREEGVRTTYLAIAIPFYDDRTFIARVMATIPREHIVAAMEFRSILAHTARYPECDVLVNLDLHCGLGGVWEYEDHFGLVVQHPLPFGRRTWAGYVSFRDNGLFRWGYPRAEYFMQVIGRADETKDGVPFEKIPQARKHRWDKLQCYHAQPPDYGVALEQVRAVAIVLNGSCDYLRVEAFYTLLKTYDLQLLDRLPAVRDRMLSAPECTTQKKEIQ
jgi:hypothetical protein